MNILRDCVALQCRTRYTVRTSNSHMLPFSVHDTVVNAFDDIINKNSLQPRQQLEFELQRH
jgi:hypothetical protein